MLLASAAGLCCATVTRDHEHHEGDHDRHSHDDGHHDHEHGAPVVSGAQSRPTRRTANLPGLALTPG